MALLDRERPAADRRWGIAAVQRGAGAVRWEPLLCLLGLAVAAVLVALFLVQRPLALGEHPRPLPGGEPIAALIGDNPKGVDKFLGIWVLTGVVWLLALVAARFVRGRAGVALVLAATALMTVTLLFAYPADTRDMFAYIVDGRVAWVHHLNPLTTLRSAIDGDPLYGFLPVWQHEPSFYGPVWQLVTFLPTRLVAARLRDNLLSFRIVLWPFLIGSILLAARIAGRRQPGREVAAAVLVGWCPLVLWETAVNGHNDIVMAFFTIFALERALHRQWAVALPLLVLATLTKYTVGMLIPLLIIAAWRTDGRRGLQAIGVGAALSLVAAVIVVRPFWVGTSTFSGIFAKGAVGDRIDWSPAALMALILRGNAGFTWILSDTNEALTVKYVTLLIFAIAYVCIGVRLWRGRDDLCVASFYALFFYLVIATWWWFPNYVVVLVVLGGALATSRAATIAIIFATTALLGHVVVGWQELLFGNSFSPSTAGAFTVLVFVPPVLFWLAGLPRPRWLADTFGSPPPAAGVL